MKATSDKGVIWWWDWLAPVVVLIPILATWQFCVWATGLTAVILPSPIQVFQALVSDASILAESCLRTAAAAVLALIGSTIVGVVTAFVFSQSALIRRALYPYAILLQTVPIIAIAPIVIIVFRRGFHSVTLVALIISVFPIITNTTTGLLQVDRNLRDLFRLQKASWWQTFWKLRLPCALPYLISGIRIASGTAVVGALVGEFFVSSSEPGLGCLIRRKSEVTTLSGLYAAVIVSTLLGTMIFALISLTGERILRRWFGMSLSGR